MVVTHAMPGPASAGRAVRLVPSGAHAEGVRAYPVQRNLVTKKSEVQCLPKHSNSVFLSAVFSIFYFQYSSILCAQYSLVSSLQYFCVFSAVLCSVVFYFVQ
jgi:hypothetical protein